LNGYLLGTGFQIPEYAASALNIQGGAGGQPQPPTTGVGNINAMMGAQTTTAGAAPPIATQCFMLSNMFDPNS